MDWPKGTDLALLLQSALLFFRHILLHYLNEL